MQTFSADAFKKKYGAEADKVLQSSEPNYQGFFQRVGNDVASTGKDMLNSITGQGSSAGESPILRGTELASQATGLPLKVASEVLPAPVRGAISEVGKATSGLINWLGDKIGSTQAAQDFVTKHPDAAKALGEVAGIAGNVANTAGNMLAIEGGVSGAKGLVNTSKSLATKIDSGLTSTVQDLKTGSKGVLSTLGKTVGDTPESIMQRVARISKGEQAKFAKVSGQSVGEYLTQRGIYGNIDKISEQLYNRYTKSMNAADNAFAQLDGTFSPTPVKTALQELVAREQRVSATGVPSPNLARASELLNKIDGKGLTMSEINEAKRLFERNVKVDYLKSASNNPEGVVRATNIDSAIRNWQYSQAETLGLKNLQAINNETRFAKQLLDAIGKEYSGSAGNNAISLSDWVLMSGGDPTAVGMVLSKKVLSSKSVQSAIAKWMNRNKPIMGEVKADIGTSKVKQLPAASGVNRTIRPSGKKIKIAPKGTNTDIIN